MDFGPRFRDRLGTVRNGGKSYYPFGEEIGTPSASNTYKFASTYRDSTTGLDYAVNRYYASGMGRFLSVDPKGTLDAGSPSSWNATPHRHHGAHWGSARLSDPGSWNRYTYASNDPVNRQDPLGLDDYTSDDCGTDGDCDEESGDVEDWMEPVPFVSAPLPQLPIVTSTITGYAPLDDGREDNIFTCAGCAQIWQNTAGAGNAAFYGTIVILGGSALAAVAPEVTTVVGGVALDPGTPPFLADVLSGLAPSPTPGTLGALVGLTIGEIYNWLTGKP